MAEQSRSWRLERAGMRAFAFVADEFACYAEDSGPAARRHRNPVWQLLLSRDGPLWAADDRGQVVTGPGILVAPGTPHTVRHPGGFTSLWIDPYAVPVTGAPPIRALDRRQVNRLVGLTEIGFDVAGLRYEMRRIAGAAPAVDPRLCAALALLEDDIEILELADRVQVSPRRLRQLAAQTIGGTLSTLRRWHRLREAGLQLPFHSTSDVAARTGFADQAHLTRTMVALCGRTPGSTPGRQL
jgi:AraC-like DNA-binding protein